MSREDSDWTNPNAAGRGFLRSALVLAGSFAVLAAPFCLFSLATGQSGSAGPRGVAAAAAVCLFAGLAAESLAAIVHRTLSPLAALLVGTAARSLPPLVVCLVLAARGVGREHLAFVVYLLTFYFVSLALDTWWAVKRVGATVSYAPRRSS